MEIRVKELDESNLAQVNQVDGSFRVEGRLILQAEGGRIFYTREAVTPYTKRYEVDEIDYRGYINNPDRAVYLAEVDGQLAGQIILSKHWNRYGYIEDIAVDAHCRKQGVGRRLIKEAIDWAKGRGLPGLMLETQNNNLAGCHLYEACGFHLGGFDNELYRAIDPNTDEVALYWYLHFE